VTQFTRGAAGLNATRDPAHFWGDITGREPG
jgi:hypothetical protein